MELPVETSALYFVVIFLRRIKWLTLDVKSISIKWSLSGKSVFKNFRAKTIIYISEPYRFSLLKCGFKLYQVRRMEVTGHSKYAVSSNSFENLTTE